MTDPAARRAAFRAAVIGAVTVVAACASSPPANPAAAAPGHAAFLKSVNDTCQRAVTMHAGHTFPVPDFDPEHPDPAELPTVGDYFARYGGLAETISALHKLTPPASDAATWRRLTDVLDRIGDNSQRQIAAARARNARTFTTTVHNASRLTDQLNAAAKSLGLRSNSPCDEVFG